MAIYFLDTSAVVKRYIAETGTAWIQTLTDPRAAPSLFLARIALVETVAAISRRQRGGQIAPADAATALADFHYDFARQYFILDISTGLLIQAASLARVHTLRAYDAVQLSAALEIHAQAPTMTFISADTALNAAAVTEGLTVENPSTHP